MDIFFMAGQSYLASASSARFLYHTRLYTTPLDEWLSCRITLKRDRHPCPRRDSNPQSQQSSGRRPTS